MKFLAMGFAAVTAAVLLYFFLHQRPLRWIVYYGSSLKADDLKGMDLAILEPDALSASDLKAQGAVHPRYLAYVSVGEVNASRSYWPELKVAGALVEGNPDWEGASRVDVRSRLWQDILVQRVIPGILGKGFDGVFLDTVDTAGYLEDREPEKYAGSRDALVEFVKKLKGQYPRMLIVPNNGLDLLDRYGNVIDGVAVEDVYTRYDFSAKAVGRTPEDVTRRKEDLLNRFRSRQSKPVYTLLYEGEANLASGDLSEAVREGIRRSKRNGYEWYISGVRLDVVGRTAR